MGRSTGGRTARQGRGPVLRSWPAVPLTDGAPHRPFPAGAAAVVLAAAGALLLLLPVGIARFRSNGDPGLDCLLSRHVPAGVNVRSDLADAWYGVAPATLGCRWDGPDGAITQVHHLAPVSDVVAMLVLAAAVGLAVARGARAVRRRRKGAGARGAMPSAARPRARRTRRGRRRSAPGAPRSTRRAT